MAEAAYGVYQCALCKSRTGAERVVEDEGKAGEGEEVVGEGEVEV